MFLDGRARTRPITARDVRETLSFGRERKKPAGGQQRGRALAHASSFASSSERHRRADAREQHQAVSGSGGARRILRTVSYAPRSGRSVSPQRASRAEVSSGASGHFQAARGAGVGLSVKHCLTDSHEQLTWTLDDSKNDLMMSAIERMR